MGAAAFQWADILCDVDVDVASAAPAESYGASFAAACDAEFDALVGLLYEGAHEPLVCAGALRLLQQRFDASWVSLLLDAGGSAGAAPQAIVCRKAAGGAEVFRAGAEHAAFFALDPFDGLSGDRVATIDEVMDTRAWVAGETYRRHLEPRQIRYILGGDIRFGATGATGTSGTSGTSGTRGTWRECRLRIMRPAVGRDFGAADKHFCRRLLPHLRRALELRARLARSEAERDLHAVVTERLQIGVVGLDAQGRIAFSNAAASAILAAQDGLLVGQGRLRASHAAEDRSLQHLIARALGKDAACGVGAGQTHTLALTLRGGHGRLGVLVRRLPDCTVSDEPAQVRCAVFIRDPRRQPEPSADVIGCLLGLTRAESALALRLAKGDSLDEAANCLAIRVTTARAHLRAIFQKTGVTRQAMLVRLLLNSVMAVG